MTTNRLLLVLSILAAHASVCLAQNPKCCVCGDNCVSTITKPDVVVTLPEDPRLPAGFTTAPCSLILQAAEQLLLIPAEFCPELDNYPQIRIDCGCENYLNQAPTAPISAPVPVTAPAPVPVAAAPVPVAVPVPVPVPAPVTAPVPVLVPVPVAATPMAVPVAATPVTAPTRPTLPVPTPVPPTPTPPTGDGAESPKSVKGGEKSIKGGSPKVPPEPKSEKDAKGVKSPKEPKKVKGIKDSSAGRKLRR